MNAKFRQTLYALGATATGILTILSVWKVIDPTTASTISASLAGILSLLGVGAASTAAVMTGKQRKDGTFTEHDPADQVINGLNAVLEAQQAANQAVDRVKEAVSQQVNSIPVLGPLASEVFDKIVK